MRELLPAVTQAVSARMGITQRGLSCLLDLKYDSDPCLKTNHLLFHLQFSPPDLLDLRPMPHFNMASEALAMMQSTTRCLAGVHGELEKDIQRAMKGQHKGRQKAQHGKTRTGASAICEMAGGEAAAACSIMGAEVTQRHLQAAKHTGT